MLVAGGGACGLSQTQRSGATLGRIHDEEPPTWRTQFQRDRDRVVHCEAFRKLEMSREMGDTPMRAWTDDYSDILAPFLSKMKLND